MRDDMDAKSAIPVRFQSKKFKPHKGKTALLRQRFQSNRTRAIKMFNADNAF